MKPIEGVSPADLVNEAEAELKRAQAEASTRQIRHLLGEAYQAQQKIERLQKEIKQAEQQRDKAIERVEKFKAGDWSAIQVKEGDQPEVK